MCRASARDTAQVADLVTYYGRLTNIILLDYCVFYIPVFRCYWANKGNGVKIEDGFTLVNLHQSQNFNSSLKKKCKLLDWCGTEEIVVEGCWVSSDPKELVNQIPLGPNATKILVDIPNIPDAFLWRPTSNMSFVHQAQGKMIAWPVERVIMQIDEQSEEQDNISGASSKYTATRKCKLFDWSGKDKVVAVGRWESCDPNILVNGIPLGPNAFSILVDISKSHGAFLWRPTSNMTSIKDAVNSTIAWPTNKVVLEKISERATNNATSTTPSSVNTNSKKKCKLLDVNGS
ncbi:hypothetical protein M0R45_024179 [Rubus argutus]|uniref:DUF8039 domain-containing protein n=1 Tax=Rubus argutus TaxID=59490 RepID=A0AAW1WRX1_RUBAR